MTGDIWDWNSNWSYDNWIAYVHGDPQDVTPSAIWAIRPDGCDPHEIRERHRLARPGLVAGGADPGGHGRRNRRRTSTSSPSAQMGPDRSHSRGSGPRSRPVVVAGRHDPRLRPRSAWIRCRKRYLPSRRGLEDRHQQLTDDDIEDGNPVWSPDGTQLAFVKATDPAHSHIWVVNADGTNPHDLMPDRDGKNMDLNWR